MAATINGLLWNTKDGLLTGVVVAFEPQSAPQFNGATIICADNVTVTSDAVAATFAIPLEPGYYNVSVGDPINTQFTIAVPAGAGPFNIGDLVTSSIAPIPGVTTGNIGLAGATDPAVAAPPGTTYVNTAANALWVKIAGTGTAGWQKFVQL